VAVQANILMFMAKDHAEPGELPNFSVNAFLCENKDIARDAGESHGLTHCSVSTFPSILLRFAPKLDDISRLFMPA